jgi:hypothetical protein
MAFTVLIPVGWRNAWCDSRCDTGESFFAEAFRVLISPLCTSDTQMGLSCFSDDIIYNVI